MNRSQISRMRDDKQSWEAIARHFGCSIFRVRSVGDPTYTERLSEAYHRKKAGLPAKQLKRPKPQRVSESDAAARLSEIPKDNRDLTSYTFGDPLPGRSALDRRMAK